MSYCHISTVFLLIQFLHEFDTSDLHKSPYHMRLYEINAHLYELSYLKPWRSNIHHLDVICVMKLNGHG